MRGPEDAALTFRQLVRKGCNILKLHNVIPDCENRGGLLLFRWGYMGMVGLSPNKIACVYALGIPSSPVGFQMVLAQALGHSCLKGYDHTGNS